MVRTLARGCWDENVALGTLGRISAREGATSILAVGLALQSGRGLRRRLPWLGPTRSSGVATGFPPPPGSAGRTGSRQALQASLWVWTPRTGVRSSRCPCPAPRWQVVLLPGECLNGLLDRGRWSGLGGGVTRLFLPPLS